MAVCQAVTVYKEGEDAVKRQRSSTAKLLSGLGYPKPEGKDGGNFTYFADITEELRAIYRSGKFVIIK
jgi:hypothetical protein